MTIAAFAALASVSVAVAPASASRRSERHQGALIGAALRDAHRAQRTADGAARAAARVARDVRTNRGNVSLLGTYLAGLATTVNTLSTSVQGLSTSTQQTSAALGTLTSKVNDANTGLGQVDNGVAELYYTPSGGSQDGQVIAVSPIFAPNVPTTRGDGATASGTAAVTCPSDATSCTVQIYAAINSNRPQPPAGTAAAQVGAGLVVTKVDLTGPDPRGAAESFEDAGQTPVNGHGDNVVDIPARRPLGSNYPGPSSGVSVPVTGVGGGAITLRSPGLYIIHGTVNFLHVTGS